MIRIEYLKITDHQQLGNIELWLCESKEYNNQKKPYTSIIIGPNGTGKSFILRTIAEILRQFYEVVHTDKKELNLSFGLHLRYRIHHNVYEIVTSRIQPVSGKKQFHYFKNRPWESDLYEGEGMFKIKPNKFETLLNELEFPSKLLVNSLMLNDRFVWQDSNPTNFYQYLGIRSTSSTSSTRSSSRRTIKHLFNASREKLNFIESLKDLLEFLDFEQSFEVHYTTKINSLFFSGELEESNFITYFENWWDPEFKYTNRKKENPLWSIPYYKNNYKDKPNKISQIVAFLNKISSKEEGILRHKKNSSSKVLPINLFDPNLSHDDIRLIQDLENLDIINLDGIKIKKQDSSLSINDLSSGEYHLLISMIGIFSSIENDSLVLIDEPEISLHPNWQMRYISFLKRVFSKVSGSQFIITTHSHFLISDLEGDTSSLTTISRDIKSNVLYTELRENNNTYGWSAEDVLYKVFNLKTTSNYYLEVDLREALSMISKKSPDIQKLDQIIKRLTGLKLNPEDPTLDIITQIISYRSKL